MPVKNTDESATILFSIEQKDDTEQVNLALEEYKKKYAEFIDLAIHDLHAPVRKLSALIERLMTKYTDVSRNDSQTEELISRIDRCLTDMRSLIDGLSEFAAVTKDSMKTESCNIPEIIKEIRQEMESEIKKKAVITMSGLPTIEGDATQLKQLFKNILDNAIRFSRKDIPSEITILSQKLTVEEKKLSGLRQAMQYYRIEISDNGIGFKQEYSQKIFQPFVRLHGNSAFGGTGLGLAICKTIADNHRGIVFAESIENKGTRITLIIPETLN